MPTDLILLGHGSRRNQATDTGLAEVVRRLQVRVPAGIRVRLAGFEFTRPSLAEAVAESAASGVERAVVVPYFLFPGREVRIKIPAELAALREQHPALEIRYADCLGAHPLMAAASADRVRETLASASWRQSAPPDARLGVVVVSRGSRAAEADAGLRQTAALVGEQLGGVIAAPAQAEIGEPRLPAAVDTVIAQGATTVVVQPYLIFPGSVLLDTVKPALEAARAAHPDVPLALARILGIDERMLDLALLRAREAGLSPDAASVAPLALG